MVPCLLGEPPPVKGRLLVRQVCQGREKEGFDFEVRTSHMVWVHHVAQCIEPFRSFIYLSLNAQSHRRILLRLCPALRPTSSEQLAFL